MTFKASCASMTGSAHLQQGTPCQDSVMIHRDRGILCAALADGAGSRPMSHLGAAQVTQTLCAYLCSRFSALHEATPQEAAAEILTACLESLRQLPQDIHSLASTLLFFAADAQGRFLSGHLGDGVQILVREDTPQVFSAPDNGEEPGVTWFVTSADALAHFRIVSGQLPPQGEMLLMSDGMAASLYQYDTQEPAKACVTLSHWLREESEALVCEALEENMKNLFSRKTADDLSLAIISW